MTFFWKKLTTEKWVLQREMAIFLRKNNTFWVSSVFPARQNRQFCRQKVRRQKCFLAFFFVGSVVNFVFFFSLRRIFLQRIYNGFSWIYNGFFQIYNGSCYLPDSNGSAATDVSAFWLISGVHCVTRAYIYVHGGASTKKWENVWKVSFCLMAIFAGRSLYNGIYSKSRCKFLKIPL